MKFSLSTNWCNCRIEDGAEIAEKALELGFGELELGFHTTHFQVAGFRKMLDRIPVGSVHAFCPVPISAPQGYPELYQLASTDADARAIAKVHVRKNIEFAADIGADTVVLHAGRVPFGTFLRRIDTSDLRDTLGECDNRTDAKPYAKLFARARKIRSKRGEKLFSKGGFLDAVRDLVPVLQKKSVTLALENLPYYEGFPDETETERIVREFADAPVRAWFDTGHHRVRECHGWTGPSAPLFGAEFAAEISAGGRPGPFAGMHLNDVTDFHDDHYAPGFGKVDFAALKPLAESVRHVVFEPNAGVTEEQLRSGLAHIRKAFGVGA